MYYRFINFLAMLVFIVIAQHTDLLSQTFSAFIEQVNAEQDSSAKAKLIDEYLTHNTVPIVEGTTIHFVYRGHANSVSVPSELNRWNPDHGRMKRIDGTDLFVREETMPINGRLEYKFWADSSWILDPLNKRKAQGGYGENSEVWMPEYIPPTAIEYNPNIPHGTIDTLWIESKLLHRTHPLYVYRPAGNYESQKLPVVYVTDGGEYLSFGKMNNVLDNLLAEKSIKPVLGVFIDPRTNPNDNSTSKRMSDYAASDTFLDFLEQEVLPFIEQNYPASQKASERVLMGASMGGLIATYAVLKRPQLFLNAAAQSPAYLQANAAVIELAKSTKNTDGNFYFDTGTIRDTREETSLVAATLKDIGAKVSYAEYPEGHNWSNWRARIEEILKYFFPRK